MGAGSWITQTPIVIIHYIISNFDYIYCSNFNCILIILYLHWYYFQRPYFVSDICESFTSIGG